MNELVQRLSDGKHPVELDLGRERTASALKQRIDQYGFVHVKFTDTRGGTALGVTLNKKECNWADADFERGVGHIRLVGSLMLNYVPVVCIAEIDLGALTGVGQLVLA